MYVYGIMTGLFAWISLIALSWTYFNPCFGAPRNNFQQRETKMLMKVVNAIFFKVSLGSLTQAIRHGLLEFTRGQF